MDTIRCAVNRTLVRQADAALLEESAAILLRWSVEARVEALLKSLYRVEAAPTFRRQLKPGESPYVTDVRGVS